MVQTKLRWLQHCVDVKIKVATYEHVDGYECGRVPKHRPPGQMGRREPEIEGWTPRVLHVIPEK